MVLANGMAISMVAYAHDNEENFAQRTYGPEVIDNNIIASSTLFRLDSGLTFTNQDAVHGVYVTGHSAGGERFSYLPNLLDTIDLNAMVIDIKDDYGYITYKPFEDSPLKALDNGKPYIKAIARIVVFKDSVLAEKSPKLSFMDGAAIWKNGLSGNSV